MSAPTYRLLFRESSDRCVYADGVEGRTVADLQHAANQLRHRIAQLSSSEGMLGVLSAHPYEHQIAALACWSLGRPLLMPPNFRPGALHNLEEQYGLAAWLTARGGAEAPATRAPAIPIRGADEPVGKSACLRKLDLPAEAPVAIFHTSGSTGTPKFALKRARQLLGEAELLARHFEIGPEQKILSTVPPHHLYGFLFGVLLPLTGQATLLHTSDHQPATLCRRLVALKATHLVTVPAHLRAIAEAGAEMLPNRLCVFSSGAPLDSGVARALCRGTDRKVIEVFGSSETGGVASRRADQDAAFTALPGLRVRCENNQGLFLRSPLLDDPSQELELADRGRPEGEGFRLLGRTDGVVKLGGKRIDLRHIEDQVKALPGVRDAAAWAYEIPGLRGTQIALAVAAPEGDWSRAGLRAALAEHFDPTVLPRQYRIVRQLPRTGTGKLLRDDLEALFANQDNVASHAPHISSSATASRTPSPSPTSPTGAQATGQDGPLTLSLEPTVATDRCVVRTTIPQDHPHFGGHFPGDPILPGVSQLTEIVLPAVAASWPDCPPFAGASRIKFSHRIRPGDAVRVELHYERGRERVGFSLFAGAQLAASGVLRVGRI